jgi:hypothetical protein
MCENGKILDLGENVGNAQKECLGALLCVSGVVGGGGCGSFLDLRG